MHLFSDEENLAFSKLLQDFHDRLVNPPSPGRMPTPEEEAIEEVNAQLAFNKLLTDFGERLKAALPK